MKGKLEPWGPSPPRRRASSLPPRQPAGCAQAVRLHRSRQIPGL